MFPTHVSTWLKTVDSTLKIACVSSDIPYECFIPIYINICLISAKICAVLFPDYYIQYILHMHKLFFVFLLYRPLFFTHQRLSLLRSFCYRILLSQVKKKKKKICSFSHNVMEFFWPNISWLKIVFINYIKIRANLRQFESGQRKKMDKQTKFINTFYVYRKL